MTLRERVIAALRANDGLDDDDDVWARQADAVIGLVEQNLLNEQGRECQTRGVCPVCGSETRGA